MVYDSFDKAVAIYVSDSGESYLAPMRRVWVELSGLVEYSPENPPSNFYNGPFTGKGGIHYGRQMRIANWEGTSNGKRVKRRTPCAGRFWIASHLGTTVVVDGITFTLTSVTPESTNEPHEGDFVFT